MALNCDCDDTTGYRTRAQIRSAIYTLMGWAVMATPPPGVEAFVNEQLRLAHSLLWNRFPAIRLARWFSWNLSEGQRFYDLGDNVEKVGLGTPDLPSLDTALTGGTITAGDHSYCIARTTDDGTGLPSAFATVTTSGATSTVTLTFPAAVPGQAGWAIYGRDPGSEELLTFVSVSETTWTDTGALTPSGAVEATDGTITCTKALDPYTLQDVLLERDTQRTRLTQGLPHTELAREQSGWPTHYTVRQCLEIWPAPSDSDGVLRVLAHFKTTAFADDSDIPGVPDDLVQLLALAACKRHYNKPDANDYIQMQEVLLNNLVGGSHGTRRYVPGEPVLATGYVEPRPVDPF